MTTNSNRIILTVAAEVDHDFVWSQLNAIQAQMFAAGPVAIKFSYFARETAPPNRPFVATRWVTDADDMADLMADARVRCECGCFVQMDDILNAAMDENRQAPVQALVILGDVFHGDRDHLQQRAKELRDAGLRVFLFQQVQDTQLPPTQTELAFRSLAETTGGAYFKFNPNIERIAQRLPNLLQAVSHFAIGGRSGLEALGNQSADMLLAQIDTRALAN
jgi:hypothetical protein